MLIIKKTYLSLSLILLFFVFSIYLIGKSETNKNYQITQVSSLPVDKKVVILDAGHRSEKIGGAVSSTGIKESDLNLKITLKLQNLLEQAGATVILTRSDDTSIYELDTKTLSQKKVSDIKNRVKIGNNSEADIFVSIHMNKIPQTQYSGFQTFYSSKNEQGKLLSEIIQSSLNDIVNNQNNRLAKSISNIYIVDHIEIPLTIVECGFLSNPQELALLLQDDYQNKLAFGIYTGIIAYFQKIQ